MRAVRCVRFVAVALLLAATGARAQFDLAKVHPEPPPVHARFAAPAVQFDPPAFAPGQIDFTRHAQMMARLCPTAMIFTPCAGGITHNNAEFASIEQLQPGANVLLHSVVERADR